MFNSPFILHPTDEGVKMQGGARVDRWRKQKDKRWIKHKSFIRRRIKGELNTFSALNPGSPLHFYPMKCHEMGTSKTQLVPQIRTSQVDLYGWNGNYMVQNHCLLKWGNTEGRATVGRRGGQRRVENGADGLNKKIFACWNYCRILLRVCVHVYGSVSLAAW